MNKLENQIERGSAGPLGCLRVGSGMNFALYSKAATQVTLHLFQLNNDKPFLSVTLDPKFHKTGWIWHVWVGSLPHEILYAYSVDGPHDPGKGFHFDPARLLTDPYSFGLNSSSVWGEGIVEGKVLSKAICSRPFDWGNVPAPRIPMQDLIIYEMHVRGFTQHQSSKVQHPGTYRGVIEKIPHLLRLGVNAVELLPIFEFNEKENLKKNPKTNEQLYNYWGYSTVNFFAPMPRYSSDSSYHGAIDEFKTMVKELHKNGIEVILDVVYNHTAEGNEKGPWYSFRGIDNPTYYMLNPDGSYMNFSGTGNTFNCNNPIVEKLILDSLRYWVTEMHVDGFRFDLASILTRDPNGAPMGEPPVIKAICQDPVLANVKLIAEAWDAGGLYQVGHFPGEGKWSEWNGRYRDIVRRFIKGTDTQVTSFARSLCGSDDLYGGTGQPCTSINFVIAHDGFTLRDLVSYQGKHNEQNGEDNRDGMNENDSWNCGQEGPTKNHSIIEMRERQMKNFLVALMVSLGVPMILMGDEYGETHQGNNNTWCQDNILNWYFWDELEKHTDLFRFSRAIINFRKKHQTLRRCEFLKTEDTDWHGIEPFKPDWGEKSRFIAYTLKDPGQNTFLYIAFNSHFETLHLTLPPPPEHKNWYLVVDTSKHSPEDFQEQPFKHPPIRHTYNLPSHTALILEAHE